MQLKLYILYTIKTFLKDVQSKVYVMQMKHPKEALL